MRIMVFKLFDFLKEKLIFLTSTRTNCIRNGNVCTLAASQENLSCSQFFTKELENKILKWI